MELIEGQAEDYAVEDELVKALDALFEKDLVFEFVDCFFVGRFDDTMIDPVFHEVILSADEDEDASDGQLRGRARYSVE